MSYDKQISLGLTGTIVSATGVSLAEISAIVSIIIAVLGFVISVLIPSTIKIVEKIKKAKADGVITKEEFEDIKQDVDNVIGSAKNEFGNKEQEK